MDFKAKHEESVNKYDKGINKERRHEKRKKGEKEEKETENELLPWSKFFLKVRRGRTVTKNKEMDLKQNCRNCDRERKNKWGIMDNHIHPR